MRYITISAVFLGCLAFSCKARRSNADAKGVFNANTAWPTQNINVCWLSDNKTESLQTRWSKATIRDFVEKEYARAGFRLRGWDLCLSESVPLQTQIAIRIADVQPWGYAGCKDAKNWCVSLNLNFNLWPDERECTNPSEWSTSNNWACYCKSEEHRKICLEVYALHEMGHALGLAHEADHEENRDRTKCNDVTKRDSNARDFGAYDPDSIMNYCKNREDIAFKRSPSLSSGDINTLRNLYGVLPTSTCHLYNNDAKECLARGCKWKVLFEGTGNEDVWGCAE